MGRTADREKHTPDVRIAWAEADLDEIVADIAALDARLSKMLWVMVGVLISTTTAAILLALNLAVQVQ